MSYWSNLYFCFGNCIASPSDDDLQSALKELFSSRNSEHPDAWLECGVEGGPLESLSIFSSGYAIHTKFSDADMSEELSSRRIEGVTEKSALGLWQELLSRKNS